MKLSDYMVDYFVKHGVKHVFGYPGGMITHLMDSLSKREEIQTHLAFHEQGAAFEGVGYAKTSQEPVVVFTSSGPGATNLLTGICDAWFDSIPIIFITGNVNLYESRLNHKVRQKGFQETDIISIVKSVTKFSYFLDDACNVKYALDTAFFEAYNERRGPCLIDIPMNITRAEINEKDLISVSKCELINNFDYELCLESLNNEISLSNRPVIVLGNAIHTSKTEDLITNLINKWQMPVVTSMPAFDLLSKCFPYGQGFIGAYGQRAANIILEKSDLVISFGARLDNRQTGTDVSWFATNAKLIRFDCDKDELELNIKKNEYKFNVTLQDILPKLIDKVLINKTYEPWLNTCKLIQNDLANYDINEQTKFLKEFFEKLPNDINITTDVGQNQIWVPQSIDFSKRIRLITSSGLGSMGFSLPAAIGMHYATNNDVYSFNGDGGLQMNIQELQFIVRDKLPIKIIVINNHSLGMIRHFQELYFDDNYFLTTKGTGFDAPDFVKVAKAYGIEALDVNMGECDKAIEFLLSNKTCLLNINMGTKTYLEPKSLYNKPLAYQLPPLPEELQDKLMKL